jgi:hypothetical protein
MTVGAFNSGVDGLRVPIDRRSIHIILHRILSMRTNIYFTPFFRAERKHFKHLNFADSR